MEKRDGWCEGMFGVYAGGGCGEEREKGGKKVVEEFKGVEADLLLLIFIQTTKSDTTYPNLHITSSLAADTSR